MTSKGQASSLLRVLVLLAILLVLPGTTLAQELHPGDNAMVSAGGDGLLLRDGPSYEASAIDLYPDGSVVSIVDGPIVAADGSVWLAVEVGNQTGYMVSDWLVSTQNQSQTSANTTCDGAQDFFTYAVKITGLFISAVNEIEQGVTPRPAMINLLMAGVLVSKFEEWQPYAGQWGQYWATDNLLWALRNEVHWFYAGEPDSYPTSGASGVSSYPEARAEAESLEQQALDESHAFAYACGLVWPTEPPTWDDVGM